MGGQHGIENVGKALDVLAEGGNVAEDVLKAPDGFVAKVSPLTQMLDELMALATLDGKEFKLEIGEIDEADLADLKSRFKAKFDLVDDAVEELLEEGLDLLHGGGEYILAVISFAKKLKAAKASA